MYLECFMKLKSNLFLPLSGFVSSTYLRTTSLTTVSTRQFMLEAAPKGWGRKYPLNNSGLPPATYLRIMTEDRVLLSV